MESKKKVPVNTVTRDIKNLAAPTGNIYESVVILYKRANQIAVAEKKELMKKLDEFRGDRDTMEEVFENKEQIDSSTARHKTRIRSISRAANKPCCTASRSPITF